MLVQPQAVDLWFHGICVRVDASNTPNIFDCAYIKMHDRAHPHSVKCLWKFGEKKTLRSSQDSNLDLLRSGIVGRAYH